MALHTKWSSGNLIFYDGTLDIMTIDKGEGGISLSTLFSEDASYAYGLQIYPSISGSPTLTYYVGEFIYMGDIGTATVANWMGLMLGLKINNAPTGNSAFIRVYSHGTEAVGSVLFMANSGGTPTTNLLDFEGLASPVFSGDCTSTGSSASTCKIACQVGAATYYLPLYST